MYLFKFISGGVVLPLQVMDALQICLRNVLVSFIMMVTIVYSGLFDQVELEIGAENYAEKMWLPGFSVMPLNTFVNFGYIGLGLYWIEFAKTSTIQGILKKYDSKLFYSLNIMTTMYGGVQFMRLATQSVLWSVLDQWCTLPFFAILLVWGLYLRYDWSHSRCLFIILASISSYSLTLFSKIGFEITLGVHIFSAVTGGVLAYRKYPSDGSLKTFTLAVLFCAGFVGLKLADNLLPKFSFIFNYISGHFLSKICDIYQIHYVNDFFLDIILEKAAHESLNTDIGEKEEPQFYQIKIKPRRRLVS